jgi:hypothetical protein
MAFYLDCVDIIALYLFCAWEQSAFRSQVQRSVDDRPCKQARYLTVRRFTPGKSVL